MIAWFRQYMSRKSPSCRSASSQKSGGKVRISFFSWSTSRPLWTTPAFKTYISHQNLHQVALDRSQVLHTGNFKSSIPHSAITIKIFHERLQPSMHIVQCTVQCKISTKNFACHEANSVRYRLLYCAAKGAGVQCWDIMNCVTLLLCNAKIIKRSIA